MKDMDTLAAVLTAANLTDAELYELEDRLDSAAGHCVRGDLGRRYEMARERQMCAIEMHHLLRVATYVRQFRPALP